MIFIASSTTTRRSGRTFAQWPGNEQSSGLAGRIEPYPGPRSPTRPFHCCPAQPSGAAVGQLVAIAEVVAKRLSVRFEVKSGHARNAPMPDRVKV